MAEWKKLVVSGSSISQLNNDAGYLTTGTLVIPNSFSTASYDGTDLLADSPSGAINFASASGQGLTISANAGTDTLTFGLSAIPNASLENDGITIAGSDISLGGSITAATILSGTDVVSGSAQVAALLPVGTVSGSSQITYSGISGIPAGIVSASVLSSPAQGEALLTTNGVAGSTVDLGLQTTDSPTFAGVTGGAVTIGVTTDNTINTTSGNLTINSAGGTTTVDDNVIISGDLTVNGTTTYINTTELLVEDKFIVLASGSAAAGDGGIIIDRGSDGQGNIAFGFDSATDRWGFQNGLTDTSNAITIGTDGNSAFVGYVFTEAAHTSAPASGEFVQAGAIYTSTAGDIFIYS